MSRYLVEVPHDKERRTCAQVVQVFLSSGSHLLTNADWGCSVGKHSAWLIVETDSEEEARNLVPPVFRAVASITALNKFTFQEVDSILSTHSA